MQSLPIDWSHMLSLLIGGIGVWLPTYLVMRREGQIPPPTDIFSFLRAIQDAKHAAAAVLPMQQADLETRVKAIEDKLASLASLTATEKKASP
jgi:hypothetical protein